MNVNIFLVFPDARPLKQKLLFVVEIKTVAKTVTITAVYDDLRYLGYYQLTPRIVGN